MARATLQRRPWPGNLRELGNTLAVAAALCEDGLIEPDDLPPEPGAGAAPASAETEALTALLARCRGNVSEAARQLKVDRTTVHRRMRRLGISTH